MKSKIVANQLVLTSALTVSDYELAVKTGMDVLVDGETKDEVFRMMFAPAASGSMSRHSVVFNTVDSEKHLQCTLAIPASPDKRKECVADMYAEAMLMVTEMEEIISANIEAKRTAYAAIMDNMEVVD